MGVDETGQDVPLRDRPCPALGRADRRDRVTEVDVDAIPDSGVAVDDVHVAQNRHGSTLVTLGIGSPHSSGNATPVSSSETAHSRRATSVSVDFAERDANPGFPRISNGPVGPM